MFTTIAKNLTNIFLHLSILISAMIIYLYTSSIMIITIIVRVIIVIIVIIIMIMIIIQILIVLIVKNCFQLQSPSTLSWLKLYFELRKFWIYSIYFDINNLLKKKQLMLIPKTRIFINFQKCAIHQIYFYIYFQER